MIQTMPFSYIKQAIRFFSHHWLQIISIQMPFLLVQFCVDFLTTSNQADAAQNSSLPLFVVLINILTLAASSASLINYFQSVTEQQPLSPMQAIQKSVPMLLPIAALLVFVGISIALGLVFFIIPGLILLARLAFADFILVVENQSIMNALVLSWQRTQPYFWPLLNGLALFMAVLVLPQTLLQIQLDSSNLSLSYALAIGFSLLNSIMAIFSFRLYCLERENSVAK